MPIFSSYCASHNALRSSPSLASISPWLLQRNPQSPRKKSFLSTTAAGQRLYPLDLFARLLIKGSVAEVDVPAQLRVRVGLVGGSSACVEGLAWWANSSPG